MRFTSLLVATTSAALLVGLAATASQDSDEGKAGEGVTEEMMASMMAYATPGENQARLATRVGRWNVHLRQWMAPGAPVEVSEGVATYQMTLGGRFLVQTYHSTWNGMEFEGSGISGHNNASGRYQFNWVDSFSTGMMQGSGTFAGDLLNWTAVITDPMVGEVLFRGTETFSDPDDFTATMYMRGPDGKEYKMMELHYVRTADVKDADKGDRDRPAKR